MTSGARARPSPCTEPLAGGGGGATLQTMTMMVRGRVRGGRLKVDEPIDLPDDTEVDVAVLLEEADDLDGEERARLHEDLRVSKAELARGEVFPLEAALAEL